MLLPQSTRSLSKIAMTTFDGHQVLGGLSKEAEESPCTDEKTEAREAVYSASVCVRGGGGAGTARATAPVQPGETPDSGSSQPQSSQLRAEIPCPLRAGTQVAGETLTLGTEPKGAPGNTVAKLNNLLMQLKKIVQNRPGEQNTRSLHTKLTSHRVRTGGGGCHTQQAR